VFCSSGSGLAYLRDGGPGGSQANRLHGIATGCTGFEGGIEGAMIDLKSNATVISLTYGG